MMPRYPIYIISKGRAKSRYTAKALERIGCPYRIVIEPQEYEQYAEVIDPAKIIQLPFSNLGQGSIPARNFVWEHSMSEGHVRHWILDDNILNFYRFHKNMRVPVADPTIFRCVEDFTERYENVPLSGMQYLMFAPSRSALPPFYLNTRVYSCILIQNDLPFRWRGRYNEDTDLSLRVLKAGHCTLLLNAFLAEKMQTMKMKGGNTDELYKDDGRLQMAQSLVDQHPDLVEVTWKWGRHQHTVNYLPFKKNELKLKPQFSLDDPPNEYGMELEQLIDGEWRSAELSRPGRPVHLWSGR